jgi:hypothetical protein
LVEAAAATETTKVPLFLEVTGEPEAGKTHLSCLMPKPALLDLTAGGESEIILKRLHPSDWKQRYWRIRSSADIETALKSILANKDNFKTVIFDTSADLRAMCSKEYIKELNKQGKERQALMPAEYKWVNENIDGFIDRIKSPDGKFCMNLVFTAQMRDEWRDNKPTGRRIRKGYPDANYQSNLRFYLQVLQKLDPKTMSYIEGEYERKCTVIKNTFRNKTDKVDWIPDLKESELNWEGVKKLTKLETGELVE